MAFKKLINFIVEEPAAAYESQIIEWKESWRDEYLRWICGFANAQGGKLVIGKNDKGTVVGLANSKKLLVDIPNKIRDILGIIADVNLKQEAGKEYLEIAVEPYPSPVNFRGEYHYRTGSTKQELKGQALDSFLLKRYGLHWDGAPHPHLKFTDLDDRAFALFVKRGLSSERLESAAQYDTPRELLISLKLADGDYLKRAAALLFAKDPETYVLGASVKIGFFRTDSDLLYQDEISGNIFSQVDRTLDLLTTKYMKAHIHYEGVQRIDKLMVPKEALREAITNAIVHKNYESANPIQISVYEDKVIIWNAATISDELPIERLLGKHPSIPNNPLLAAAFFRAGYIESWGRGIDKMKSECRLAKADEPEIKYDFGGVMATFTGTSHDVSGNNNPTDSEPVLVKLANPAKQAGKGSEKGSEKSSEKIIALIQSDTSVTIAAIAEKLYLSTRAIEKQLAKLQAQGIIHRIGPDKGGHWKVAKKMTEAFKQFDVTQGQLKQQKNTLKNLKQKLLSEILR